MKTELPCFLTSLPALTNATIVTLALQDFSPIFASGVSDVNKSGESDGWRDILPDNKFMTFVTIFVCGQRQVADEWTACEKWYSPFSFEKQIQQKSSYTFL